MGLSTPMTTINPHNEPPRTVADSPDQLGGEDMNLGGARKRLAIYLLLTFTISWAIFWPAVKDRPDELDDVGWRFIAVAVPSLVAIVLALIDSSSNRKVFFRRFLVVRLAWWRSLLLFYGLAVALLGVLAVSDPPGVITMVTKPQTLIVLVALPVFAILTQGVGGPLEEAGWRGYALPLLLRLAKPIPASVVLGVIHAGWHLPLFMIGTYPSSDADEISLVLTLALFFVHVINVSILLTWVFLNSRGSIWLAVLAHAIINFTLAGQNVHELVRDEQLDLPLHLTGTVLGAMASTVAVLILLSFAQPRRQLLGR